MDVTNLSIQQLQQLRKQMIEDTDTLATSYAQLRQIQGKYSSCHSVLEHIKPTDGDIKKTILIPLTNSLYVPGKMATDGNVLVDAGTGYYFERPVTSAQEYYKRKIDFVENNASKLQTNLNDRQKQINDVTDLLAVKIEAVQNAAKANESSSLAEKK